MQMSKHVWQGLGLAALVAALDQLSKWIIVAHVMNPPVQIEVTSFFNLVLAHNRGVSFGMFAAGSELGKWILVGLALMISGFLVRWLFQSSSPFSIIALGLILGGAVGNVIDRVLIGAVVDFLDFHAFGTHWPAFNVADTTIFLGAAGLIFESFFSKDEAA
jgi:signal peptidase II|tara:strand:- start:87 stop:569 length:483 start_codon:yes stop_codon:yes gene_type:complete